MTVTLCKGSYDSSVEIKSKLRRQELHRQKQGSKFIKSTFSNRDNKRGLIQFRGERQPPTYSKMSFLQQANPFSYQQRKSYNSSQKY